jgi:hypothetical protein
MYLVNGSLSKAIIVQVVEDVPKNNWSLSFLNTQRLKDGRVPLCEENFSTFFSLYLEVPEN